MSTISADQFVSITPSVVSAGGSALDLNGLVLSTTARVPIGSVQSFPSLLAVQNYFGTGTTEALIAAGYFAGFDTSTVKPGAILFAQYPTTAVGAFLRGGNLSALSLTALQALSGTLIVTVSGTVKTSSTINLAAATSFSNAATIITAGFTTPGFAVTFDSVSSAFLFTNTTTGSTSTLTFATGTLATSLALTQATGAVLSQGAAAAVPATFMANVITQTQNWCSFMTAFDPDAGAGNTIKQAFAAWTNSTGNRYLYAAWDTDITPLGSNAATTSLGYILNQIGSAGTAPLIGPDYTIAAFLCGAIASVNFEQVNGRTSFAFKTQAGLAATINTDIAFANSTSTQNGYSGYCAVGTANQQFNWFAKGAMTGPSIGGYKWIDAYINQIWLNNQLQLAIVVGLQSVLSVPYNPAGYALIRSWCMDPINQALNFGAIRNDVPLSSAQAAEVNNAAGLAIDKTLTNLGWYLQILPASAQARAARSTPPITLWYMDGGSVQQINLASILVQ